MTSLRGISYFGGQHGLNSISACINNHMSSKVSDEFPYPFPNINGATVEVWECIYNIFPHFKIGIITYSCWNVSYTMLEKGVPGCLQTLPRFYFVLTGCHVNRLWIDWWSTKSAKVTRCNIIPWYHPTSLIPRFTDLHFCPIYAANHIAFRHIFIYTYQWRNIISIIW